jgi:hypothetical protein
MKKCHIIYLYDMLSKICSSCKTEQSIEFFHKYKNSKDGHTHRCKTCVSRKKIVNETEKECTVCNIIKPLPEYNKRKNGKLGYSSVCQVCNNQKRKSWINSNKEHHLEYRKNYRKNRIINDPSYKLINNLRCRLNDFLNFRNIKKHNTTVELIGCTPKELKIYLESKFIENMSWENYGYTGWHVDHRIPLSSAKNISDIYKLFHYTNLQPLWGIDNLKKGNKILKDES